jgi:Zn-dependent M28 family amino/carboxypeptidase
MLLGHMDGWFQAAADNGGGAAGVLRAAHELISARPATGVVVVLADGEEYGLLGSKALAAQISSPAGLALPDGAPALHMGDLKAVMNLDASSARASDVQDHVASVAGRDAPVFSWRAMVFSEEPVLPAAFLTTFAAHQVMGLPLQSQAAVAVEGGWRTDAQWFHQAGVPVVWPVAGYPEYHTDGDTLAAVDPADLENIAAAAVDLAGQLATLPVSPVAPQFR